MPMDQAIDNKKIAAENLQLEREIFQCKGLMDGGFQSYIAQKSLEVKSKLAAKPIQVLKLAFCHLFVYMTVLAERWL